MMQETYTVI